MDKPPPLARPRSPRRPEAPAAALAAGHVAERSPNAAARPPAPPFEPPTRAAAHKPDAGPKLRVCNDVSASYAGSSTSSRSSPAPGDSGISSSLESRHDDSEGEQCTKPQSPRPPPWKVRGVREDQLPNDLHRRFCEEIKSRYQLQTEEDRHRRLLAIERVDNVVSKRLASSVGREVPTPRSRLRRRPNDWWVTSGDKGPDRSNSSETRSFLSSSAAEGRSENNEGRKSTLSGRDDTTAVSRREPLDQYPNYMLTNSYQDSANPRQLENNQEQRRMCDIFSKKLTVDTYETEKDQVYKANTRLNHTKEKRTDADKGGMPNEWGYVYGGTETISRRDEVSEFQTVMSRDKRYGQNEMDSAFVRNWRGEKEGLQKQEQNEQDNILLQAGQSDINDIKELGAETPQCDSQQLESRNAEEGNVSAQSSTASDFAGRALLSKDNAVMQLLLGGYFKYEHSEPCWPRIGPLRRTVNQLDVSIHSWRDPVERQSVETQTLPVHVSRRLTHVDEPPLEFAPKIKIDHRGGLTRYYGIGHEGSVGSVMTTGAPGNPSRPPVGADAGLPDGERMPSYLVLERPPPSRGCASQRSHNDRSPHSPGTSAQWISPDIVLTDSHNSRHSSMAQSVASHTSGDSTSSGRTCGLALKPLSEVNNGSHHRNIASKLMVARSCDHDKGACQALEDKQGKKSAWSRKIVPVFHSIPQQLPVNEGRVKTEQLCCSNKNIAETMDSTQRLALSDKEPLTPEEELYSVSLTTSNQNNRRVSLDDLPAGISRAGEGRNMQYSSPNAHENELHHRVDPSREEETKKKAEHHSDQHHREKIRKRFAPRHPRHSRRQKNTSRKTQQEEKLAEPDRVSEPGRITQHSIQSPQRVVKETDLRNSCRGKYSSDKLDVLLPDIRFDSKGDNKRHFRHNAHSKRVVRDQLQEDTSDDAHELIGSTELSSDSINKSSTSLSCHCYREQAQATSCKQCNVCKFVPVWKKAEMWESRRSADQSRSCATQREPRAAFLRNADCRMEQEIPYELNDSRDEDITHCRSSCSCGCRKTLGRHRFQPDVSGRQATHVAKRAQCGVAASASETPCCCQAQQSVQREAGSRGGCSACRREVRSRSNGPASEKRSFHECYCGSRRVCYSIMEDEEEAAAAEEAKGSTCSFVHALSFFENHSSDGWSQ